MKGRRAEAAVLLAGLAALALFAYAKQNAAQRSAPSFYSTYDTGPNGYGALYATLRRAGLPVRRFERALPMLDAGVGTLVLSTFAGDPQAKPMRSSDKALLERFVRRGGRLVVLDSDFAGKDDLTPGVGISAPVSGAAAVALAPSRYTAGVAAVRVPIVAAFPYARWARATPLLGNRNGVVAVAYPVGKGEILAISVPALFSNARLTAADNLAFDYNALAGHGVVAFDEYVHGYDDASGFWQVLPPPVRWAAWTIGAIVVLALIGANVPFAPPIPADPPDERDSSAYVAAMASLLRRGRAGGTVIAALRADAARRTRGRTLAAGVAAALAELDGMSAGDPPSDAGLVRAAALDFRLRKEFP